MRKQLVLLLTLLAPAFLASAQFKSENLFYMVDNAESFESFRKNAAQISIVSPQVFNMSKEGVLTGSIHPKILEVAKANNVKVMPLIVNTGFNAAILHSRRSPIRLARPGRSTPPKHRTRRRTTRGVRAEGSRRARRSRRRRR